MPQLVISPRRLLGRFRPAGNGGAAPGFLPALQAYGGLQAFAARSRYPVGTLGRLGSLEVRLARSAAEVRKAQKLRYRVFYQEGAAIADPSRLLARRDIDAFDAICDHLLVFDHAAEDPSQGRGPAVVGTYRLLRQSMADDYGGFYTSGEFDISGLVARHTDLRFLELGRSCVLGSYRNKRTLELLWHGISAYLDANRVDVMIGCGSLDGTDPNALSTQLSFLHHFARAPELWAARALPERYVEMNRVAKETIDPKRALRELPPLIKGYLRLGAYIGDGAVVDYEFGTTDVLIVLPMSALKRRYLNHFVHGALRPEQHAA
ncbi:MAG TPA: GNAT family N-acyltransferase [Pseudolabrys sp.]|nr:GNAT family N-acyltransferase [Pseudolabrys sp.]